MAEKQQEFSAQQDAKAKGYIQTNIYSQVSTVPEL
jgi:hypothetical protein